MSLSPLVDPEVRGVKGKEPELNAWCSIPGCLSRSQERHHLWPKSALRGQPIAWVSVPSGATIANSTGVCIRHHKALTGVAGGGHLLHIRLEHGDLLTAWEKGEDDTWQPLGLLSPQPEIIGRKHSAELAAAKAHTSLEPGETCGTCGYTRPKKTKGALPRRRQQTWTVNVPADAEIGAEVLDEWVEQFAALLGFDSPKKGVTRYHVLAVVLAWSMQHRDVLIADLAEARSA